MHRATQRWLLGVVVVGVLIAILADLKAQPAPGNEAQVLAADQALGDAIRSGNTSTARKLLSLQFTFVDENGKIHLRKDVLAALKRVAAAPASGAEVKLYGRVAMVTGHHESAHGDDAFFLHIWAKQRGAWRALIMQDVVLAPPGAQPATPIGPDAGTKSAVANSADAQSNECKNPCKAIPYRVRSPAEQAVVNSYQAIENAAVAHDAGEWSKHMADEFVLYGSGRAPLSKSARIAKINRQKDSNAAVTVGEVQTMRLSVYGDGAAMIASHVMPDDSRPPYRAARVWVKRNGQWQMAISVQTDVK